MKCASDLFGIRIVTTEYTVEAPQLGSIIAPDGRSCSLDPSLTKLTQKPLLHVPIVRVFGPTTQGDHGAVNVHGCFPYFYVDWPWRLSLLFDGNAIRQKKGLLFPDDEDIDVAPSGCASSLSPPFSSTRAMLYALACFLDDRLEAMTENTQYARGPYVYDIQVVFRRSIYGPTVVSCVYWCGQINNIHQAAALLHGRHFWDVDFQPYEVHLIGLQFMADLNLRGMDYLWLNEAAIIPNQNSTRYIVCDEHPLECHRVSILNQYLTVLGPDDSLDAAALSKCTELTLRDGCVVSECPGVGRRILSATLDFPIDTADRSIGWLPSNHPHSSTSQQRFILSWDDPWPSDFDEPHAPPVGPALEEIWVEEERRRKDYGFPRPQSLYERQKNHGYQRKVTKVSEMMEISGRNALCQQLGWEKYLPTKDFATEHFLLNCETIVTKLPPKTAQNDDSGLSWLSPFPRWSESSDLTPALLKSESRLQQKIFQKYLLHRVPCSAYKASGFSQVMSQMRLAPQELLFYPAFPPKLASEPKQKKRPWQLMQQSTGADLRNTAARVLNVSLDNAGRINLARPTKRQKAIEPASASESVSETMPSTLSSSASVTGSITDNSLTSCLPSDSTPRRQQAAESASKRDDNNNSDSDSVEEVSPTERAVIFSKRSEGYLQLLRNVKQARQLASPAKAPSLRQTLLVLSPKPATVNVSRNGSSSRFNTPPRSPQMPTQRTRNSPGERIRDRQRHSLDEKKLPVLSLSTRKTVASSAQTGLHVGRSLGFDVITELARSDGALEPRTHRQAKQGVPDPRTCRILAVVYVCRFEVCSDLSFESQRERFLKVVPGDLDKPYSIPEQGVLDIPGVTFVKEDETTTWNSVEVPVSREYYRFQQLCGGKELPSFLGPEESGLPRGTIIHATPTENDLIYWVLHKLFRQFDPTIVLGFNTATTSIGYFIRRAEILGFKSIDRHLGRVPPRYPLVTLSETVESHHQHRCGPRRATSGTNRLLRVSGTSRGNLLHSLALSLRLLDVSDILARSEEMARLLGTDLWSTIARGQQHRVESLLIRSAHTLGYLMLTASKTQVKSQPAVMAIPLVLEPQSAFYWWPVVVLDFQSLYPSVMIAYNLCFTTCLGRWRALEGTSPLGTDDTNSWKPLGVFRVQVSKPQLQLLQQEILSQSDRSTAAEAEMLAVMVTSDETMYVSRSIRRGLIPSLLEEVISTRVITKESVGLLASSFEDTFQLRRLLNHRQFALKLFANCTYGYCGATVSGRMPCSEVADSIVHMSRRTLERSIAYIEGEPRWNARVVYGDTDSLFVHLEGRSLHEAFEIGREIVQEITSINPWPIQLQLEKVYYPCCLQTKKRYVGYSYSTPTATPKLDSKGIETVRRDQCELVRDTLSKVLTTLFATRNLSRVRQELQEIFQRLLHGEPYTPFKDYIFLRELRLGSYAYESGKPAHTLPPQAVVSYAMAHDWFQPNQGDNNEDDNNVTEAAATTDIASFFDSKTRIPYIVVHGPPGSRLIDLVVPPDREASVSQPLCPLSPVLPQGSRRHYNLWKQDHPLFLNAEWYIMKQIVPVLQRLFCLLNPPVHITKWLSALPRLSPTRPLHTYGTLRVEVSVDNDNLDHPIFTLLPYRAEAARKIVLPHQHHHHHRRLPTLSLPHPTTEYEPPQFEMIDLAVTTSSEDDDEGDDHADAISTELDSPTVHKTVVTTHVKQEDTTLSDTLHESPLHSVMEDDDVPQTAGNDGKAFQDRRDHAVVGELTRVQRRVKGPPIAPLKHVLTLDQFLPVTSSCRICGVAIASGSTTRRRSGQPQALQLPVDPQALSDLNEGLLKTGVSAVERTLYHSLCPACLRNPQETLLRVELRRNILERRAALLTAWCVHCTGNRFAAEACHDAFYCPVYTKKIHARQELATYLRDIEDLGQAEKPPADHVSRKSKSVDAYHAPPPPSRLFALRRKVPPWIDRAWQHRKASPPGVISEMTLLRKSSGRNSAKNAPMSFGHRRACTVERSKERACGVTRKAHMWRWYVFPVATVHQNISVKRLRSRMARAAVSLDPLDSSRQEGVSNDVLTRGCSPGCSYLSPCCCVVLPGPSRPVETNIHVVPQPLPAKHSAKDDDAAVSTGARLSVFMDIVLLRLAESLGTTSVDEHGDDDDENGPSSSMENKNETTREQRQMEARRTETKKSNPNATRTIEVDPLVWNNLWADHFKSSERTLGDSGRDAITSQPAESHDTVVHPNGKPRTSGSVRAQHPIRSSRASSRSPLSQRFAQPRRRKLLEALTYTT